MHKYLHLIGIFGLFWDNYAEEQKQECNFRMNLDQLLTFNAQQEVTPIAQKGRPFLRAWVLIKLFVLIVVNLLRKTAS